MKVLVKGTQRRDLDAEEMRRLYAAMNAFYTDIPDGVTLLFDLIRTDRKGSYSVLEVPDRETIERIVEPFSGLVEIELVEVITAEEAMGS